MTKMEQLCETNSEKGCDISAIVNPWVSPLANSAKIHTKPCAGLRLKRAQRFDYPLLLSKHIYFEKLALKWH